MSKTDKKGTRIGWKLTPVAIVRNNIYETPDDWDKVVSQLVFRKDYVEGLYKLSHFRHVWVIFGFHKNSEFKLKVHPMHDPRKPLVGVFASCSPTRPNRLGLTRVRLISVKERVATVKGLDAFDGSPVFDIKPVEEEIDY